MQDKSNEGADPSAQEAAEEWRRRFGREGHEGSYAPQFGGEGKQADERTLGEAPSRTSPPGSSA